MQYMNPNTTPNLFERDKQKLEIITISVGFDDILDVTISENHTQCDHLIIVTTHEDKATQSVCRKHGVTCVPTDVINPSPNEFRKGAGINRGFDFLRYYGWRLYLDADIFLHNNFNRILFNHTYLDESVLYGCDRINVSGLKEFEDIKKRLDNNPQHAYGYLINPSHGGTFGSRYVDGYDLFCPIGAFQLWHASQQKPYPSSKNEASHDDVSWAKLWPRSKRQLLPSTFVYHLVPEGEVVFGANWKGRTQPRIK